MKLGIRESVAEWVERVSVVIAVGVTIHVIVGDWWHLKQTELECQLIGFILYYVVMTTTHMLKVYCQPILLGYLAI